MIVTLSLKKCLILQINIIGGYFFNKINIIGCYTYSNFIVPGSLNQSYHLDQRYFRLHHLHFFLIDHGLQRHK